MRIIRLPFLRDKRGISTIIGTMIFIGIIFTSVVPMYLVMRQADTIYDQKAALMNSLDQERADEEIIVYTYPLTDTSNKLEATVDNTGAITITIVRLWINDTPYPLNVTVSSMRTETLGLFNVVLPAKPANCSYYITVVTSRGNVFPSTSGTLYYSDGTWYTASLGISVNIANDQGKYDILVKNMTWSDEYKSKGTEFGDVIHWFEVATPGTYTVTIQKYKGGSKWVNLPGTPVNVMIQWPGGTPIVYVYARGIDV